MPFAVARQAMFSTEPGTGGGLLPAPGTLRKCLVVGSGVAGLQVTRQMLKLNYQVLVLEANADVGGVWMQNYVGYSLQVPWHMYQFPEFLWPEDLQPTVEYPTGIQVQRYVRAYAQHFNLTRHIRLNCKLLRLRWSNSSRSWEALYCDNVKEKFYKTTVDYVVMCSGIYSSPFIPSYTGSETFAGMQIHAKDFTDMTVVKGRRVVIVGSGKTAMDCVCGLVSSRCASSVTMLYRQAHWPVPRSILGIPIRRLLFNRAMVGMLPPYYTASNASRATAAVTKPLKRLFWRGLECIISQKFRVTNKLKPPLSLPADLFYGGQILDDRLDEHMDGDDLTMLRGEINCFVRNGVILQDGSFHPADIILYCTGYEKSYDYLEGEMRARLCLQKDGLYLYRNCLPSAVPHLAFVGSEVSTYNNILTHGLQALWLANLLAGRVHLPSASDMAADIREQQRWRREVMPPQRSRGAVLMLYGMKYHDQLLQDMGHKPQRKGANPLAECFGAYSAADYGHLVEQDGSVIVAAPVAKVAKRPAGTQRAVVSREDVAMDSCDMCVSGDSWLLGIRGPGTIGSVSIGVHMTGRDGKCSGSSHGNNSATGSSHGSGPSGSAPPSGPGGAAAPRRSLSTGRTAAALGEPFGTALLGPTSPHRSQALLGPTSPHRSQAVPSMTPALAAATGVGGDLKPARAAAAATGAQGFDPHSLRSGPAVASGGRIYQPSQARRAAGVAAVTQLTSLTRANSSNSRLSRVVFGAEGSKHAAPTHSVHCSDMRSIGSSCGSCSSPAMRLAVPGKRQSACDAGSGGDGSAGGNDGAGGRALPTPTSSRGTRRTVAVVSCGGGQSSSVTCSGQFMTCSASGIQEAIGSASWLDRFSSRASREAGGGRPGGRSAAGQQGEEEEEEPACLSTVL